MPCWLRWVAWRVKWINVHERDLYSNIILQSIITRCSSSMLRVIFGWDACRFPFSSEIQPSKKRGETRKWRWYFQNRERGAFSIGPVWTHVAFCCFRLLQSYCEPVFPMVSAGLVVELGLSNRGNPHFVATQTLSPRPEDQGGPQDRPQSFCALQVNAGEAESWFCEFAWLSTPVHPGVLLENQMPGKEEVILKGLFSYMRSVSFHLRKPSILPCNTILERGIALPRKNCIFPGIRMPCLSFN